MSIYWGLHCKTCNICSDATLNHGEHILRGIVKAAPYIHAALEADDSGYLEISVMGYGQGLISFLNNHTDHELELYNEYGEFKPVDHNLIALSDEARKKISDNITSGKYDHRPIIVSRPKPEPATLESLLDHTRKILDEAGPPPPSRIDVSERTFARFQRESFLPAASTVYGIEIHIDEKLPDNAIRVGDNVIYNIAKDQEV